MKRLERAKKRIDENIQKYGSVATQTMREFIDVDTNSISAFCKSMKINQKDFNFYRNICANVDLELSKDVDDRCDEIRKKFIVGIIKSSKEVAVEMKRCHQEKVPYNLYEHYRKYGFSPAKIAKVAASLDMVNASKIINQYINIHKAIFSPFTASTFEALKQQASIAGTNFSLETGRITVSKEQLEVALADLRSKSIPLCRGTIYYAVKNKQLDNKTKVYKK